MATRVLWPLGFAILLVLVFSNVPVIQSVPASAVCSKTQYPKFCRSTFLPYNTSLNEFGRISLRRALSHANKFLSLVRRFLRRAPQYFPSSIGALQDCEFLAAENVDSLRFAIKAVNFTNNLQSYEATDVEALLSATLTNLDTCLDGLKTANTSSGAVNGLASPLANATKLCSLSLNLFDRAWLRHPKNRRMTLERKPIFSDMENGVADGLPLKMSEWERLRYESLSGRRLLGTPPSSSVNVTQMVVVDKNGGGNFTAINDAVAAAPNSTAKGMGYFVIYVVQGNYHEYVTIPRNKAFIMMIGDGMGKTIITGNRSVADGWTTFNSSTFAVMGQGFVGINMTIRNTAGAIKYQAVALRNGADMSAFYSCSLEGYQDTLYAHSLRQFYRDCSISGTVDFIFGNAAVVFQNCKLSARYPLPGQFNAITAQGRTDPNQNTGTAIQNCTIVASKELVAANYSAKTFLGRPWKQYSTTVYMQSRVAGFIDPAGWAPWDGDLGLSTLYYAEFNNTGPGANTTRRISWPGYRVLTNATDAYNFTVTNLTNGNLWLPASAVPFFDGLL